MTSTNIPGTHSRSNLYYLVLLGSCRLSPCQEGELGILCQLSICLMAHQYSLAARHLHIFEAAFLGPRRVLQYGAVDLQISILLQKAEPIISLDLGCIWEICSQGLLAHNRCGARRAFPSPCIEVETLLPLSGVREEWKA